MVFEEEVFEVELFEVVVFDVVFDVVFEVVVFGVVVLEVFVFALVLVVDYAIAKSNVKIIRTKMIFRIINLWVILIY